MGSEQLLQLLEWMLGLFDNRLHVASQFLLEQIEDGIENLVFPLEMMINGGGSHPHPPGEQHHIEPLHALLGNELNGCLDDLLAAYFRGEFQDAHCSPWLFQTVEKIEP